MTQCTVEVAVYSEISVVTRCPTRLTYVAEDGLIKVTG
jgi:hypothetical protein